ncbi:EF-hand calcium-binding domain-containing protein 10 [Blastocladiella emersonii ATCC 22665]|nr:EF-hand calcium-binding domain-containing protein 10 [Blastocladiella emersonii ATCC 22665]
MPTSTPKPTTPSTPRRGAAGVTSAAPPASAVPDSVAEQLKVTQAYLDQHQVVPVLHRLVELLVYHQPDNPRAFMARHLRDLHAVRTAGGTSAAVAGKAPGLALFTRENLVNVFKIYDAAGSGVLNQKQFAEAMAFLGIKKATVPKLDSIPTDYFVQEAERALNNNVSI